MAPPDEDDDEDDEDDDDGDDDLIIFNKLAYVYPLFLWCMRTP